VLHLDVPVVHTVHDHDGGAHLPRLGDVVAGGPDLPVVAGLAVLRGLDLPDDLVADLRVPPGQHVLGQDVEVLALVPAGGDDAAVGAVVVVPAGDRRDRDDGLQPGHAGRGGHVRQRPVVGLADHADVPGRPVRPDGRPVRRPAAGAAVQPVDRRPGPGLLAAVAGGGAAGGAARANAVQVRDGVPARQEVVVVVAGEHVVVALGQ